MASLTLTTSGLRLVQFYTAGENGKRKHMTLRLGRVSASYADRVKGHVEQIQLNRTMQQPLPAETVAWLRGLKGELARRMADVGLIRHRETSTLAAFLDRCIAARTDLKPFSRKNLRQTRDSLVGFFTADYDLREITQPRAIQWQRDAKTKYAGATVAAFTKKARQMFGEALAAGLIESNPFVGVKAGKMSNPSRLQYVPPTLFQKVVDACPHEEWALIFALARWGGLRIPSEMQEMRWTDVDFDGGRMKVLSPKTHHQGKSERTVPISPELRPYLEKCHRLRGGAMVIERIQRKNLRGGAERIFSAAKVTPWPRMFQNLRASREIDWAMQFPLHVVCAWMGHTEAVAFKHYLGTMDRDYERAAKSEAMPIASGGGSFQKNPVFGPFKGFAGKSMPLVEASSRRKHAKFLAEFHRALTKEKLRLEQAFAQLREHDINLLQKRVRSAQRRVARRQRGGRR